MKKPKTTIERKADKIISKGPVHAKRKITELEKAIERRASMQEPNGDHAPRVPPDIVWSETDPVVLFNCSQYTEHVQGCDGNCGSTVPDELQVELYNEARAWARAGMNFMGVPSAYAGTIPVRGINVELFDLECKFQVVREMLIELMGVDEDELEIRFRKFKLMAMRNIRSANEDKVKRERVEQIVPKKQIFGPGGQPLL